MKTTTKLAAEIESLRHELAVLRAQLEALQADAIKNDWAQSFEIGKELRLKRREVMGLVVDFPLTTQSLDSEDEPFRYEADEDA